MIVSVYFPLLSFQHTLIASISLHALVFIALDEYCSCKYLSFRLGMPFYWNWLTDWVCACVCKSVNSPTHTEKEIEIIRNINRKRKRVWVYAMKRVKIGLNCWRHQNDTWLQRTTTSFHFHWVLTISSL